MALPGFKGSITTTGRSEAIRLEKALFKAHPEFKQRAKVQAHVLGPGSLLLTLEGDQDQAPPSDEIEGDPIVAAYLAFLENDMTKHPERLQPFIAAEVSRIQVLTRDVVVSDEDVIPDDVGL